MIRDAPQPPPSPQNREKNYNYAMLWGNNNDFSFGVEEEEKLLLWAKKLEFNYAMRLLAVFVLWRKPSPCATRTHTHTQCILSYCGRPRKMKGYQKCWEYSAFVHLIIKFFFGATRKLCSISGARGMRLFRPCISLHDGCCTLGHGWYNRRKERHEQPRK